MNGFYYSLKPSCPSFPQRGPRPNAKCVRAANCSRPFACSDIHDGSDIHSMPNAFSTSNNGVMLAQAWREGDKKYSQMLSYLTSFERKFLFLTKVTCHQGQFTCICMACCKVLLHRFENIIQ